MTVSRGMPPAWPVIDLSVTDGAVVADPAGIGQPVRVPVENGDAAEAARLAALAALDVLAVPRCRVRGTDDDVVWFMVVDRATGTLAELPDATGGDDSSPLRGWVQRHRWTLVSALSITCMALVGAAFMLSPGPAADSASKTGPVVPAADPGQLPVAAPPGFNTYADFVLPIEDMKPDLTVVAASHTLLVADGQRVIATDTRTGRESWRTDVGQGIDRLVLSADKKQVYAISGAAQVAQIRVRDGRLSGSWEASADRIAGGPALFAQGPGQTGAVLTGRGFETRQVPATSTPVGVVGDGLVSVSVSTARLWVTTSDDPVLPEPVAVPAPRSGSDLDAVVGFWGDRLVTRWSGNGGTQLACHTVTPAGALASCGVIPEPEGSDVTGEASASDGLVAVDGLLVDVSSFQKLADGLTQPVTVSAGAAWSGLGADRVRVGRDGQKVPVAESAPVPDVLLGDGRAVVRAARGATGNAVYVLVPEERAPVRKEGS